MRSRFVKPRASRSALIAASVPDETSRTFSIDGTASAISAASSTSASVVAPKRRAAQRRLAHRLDRLRIGVPEEQRAPRQHPVEVAVAVDVDEIRAFAARDEERLVEPDGLHRAHRRVDAAGDQLERAAVEIASASSEPLREVLRPVRDDQVGAGALDRGRATRAPPAARPASPPARRPSPSRTRPRRCTRAIGTSNDSRAARITSRYGSAGLIMIASAPSSMSSSHSRSASRTFAGSIW